MKNPAPESLAQRKFDSARKRLAASLLNLEKAMRRKISQEVAESKMMADDDGSSVQAKLAEVVMINKNLEEEMRELQKNFAEVGKENLFLHEKSKFLGERIKNFQEHGGRIIESVERQLAQIEEIVNHHDS